MIWFLLACADPPLLDEVAGAYGDAVEEESSASIGLFVSVAAIVAEPCSQPTIDGYVLTGEGYRALKVTTPQVTLGEDGTRTYAYGTIVYAGDVGDLTLTSDENRRSWTARWGGAEAVLTANYSIVACEAGEEGAPATLVSVAGTGTWLRGDGTEESLAVTGGDAAALSWSPGTAPVPTAGTVTWHVTSEKQEVALADAGDIDGIAREWPGSASGSGWTAPVVIVLP